MYTLPFPKSSTLAVVLKDQTRILAKITAFDPESGRISWIDLDRKWRGKVHVSHAVIATPQQIAERDARVGAQGIPLPFPHTSILRITLKDDTTILARITKYTEATGIVKWLDVAGTWSGSIHVSAAIVASPEDVRAAEAAAAARMAPVDPCMDGWTLGTSKRGPMMMEGSYYAIPVLHHGKAVGKLVDRGDGGSVWTEFKDHALGRTFEKACAAWVAASTDSPGHHEPTACFWHWWENDRPKGITAKAYLEAPIPGMPDSLPPKG